MAVNELTPLSSLRITDSLVVQTPGEQGDVMLAAIGDLISEIFDPIFARLQSPEFTGEPTVPSITDLDANDLRAANTEFVQAIAEKKADVKDDMFGSEEYKRYLTGTTLDTLYEKLSGEGGNES